MYSSRFSVQETDVLVRTDKPVDKKFLQERIIFYRRQIEEYIIRDARFLASLVPVSVELGANVIVKQMAKAAQQADVGPMASVAGAIAFYLGRDLLKQGFKEVIIENGGDIFMKSVKKRYVGVYSGGKNYFRGICLLIEPGNTPTGICTSSGTLGHSLSFGAADSVIIISKNPLLADAVATAACNRVKSADDLQKAVDFAKSVKGIDAAVVIMGKNLATWGKIKFARPLSARINHKQGKIPVYRRRSMINKT